MSIFILFVWFTLLVLHYGAGVVTASNLLSCAHGAYHEMQKGRSTRFDYPWLLKLYGAGHVAHHIAAHDEELRKTPWQAALFLTAAMVPATWIVASPTIMLGLLVNAFRGQLAPGPLVLCCWVSCFAGAVTWFMVIYPMVHNATHKAMQGQWPMTGLRGLIVSRRHYAHHTHKSEWGEGWTPGYGLFWWAGLIADSDSGKKVLVHVMATIKYVEDIVFRDWVWLARIRASIDGNLAQREVMARARVARRRARPTEATEG